MKSPHVSVFLFLFVVVLPPAYGKVINRDASQRLAPQVSVRLWRIKGNLQTRPGHKQLSALLESALGGIVRSIQQAV